jgi:hypothetical protein
MRIADIPNDTKLITDSQDVNAVIIELGLPLDGEYGGLFITDEGKVYGFSGTVPYLEKIADYLGILGE